MIKLAFDLLLNILRKIDDDRDAIKKIGMLCKEDNNLFRTGRNH